MQKMEVNVQILHTMQKRLDDFVHQKIYGLKKMELSSHVMQNSKNILFMMYIKIFCTKIGTDLFML